MSEKKLVATWLRIVSYILVGIFVVLDYLANLIEFSPVSIFEQGQVIGATFWTLIGGFIFIACGNKCSKWASEIKKSPSVAYVVGFTFSLLGLFGYWIYYKVKSK